MKTNYEVNETVRFTLGHNIKTSVVAKVLSTGYRFVYVRPERISGKFVKSTQKNTLCIPKNQLI